MAKVETYIAGSAVRHSELSEFVPSRFVESSKSLARSLFGYGSFVVDIFVRMRTHAVMKNCRFVSVPHDGLPVTFLTP
jgi:hypothetical protein